MASKNSIKIYTPDGYYHIYNRGVNKSDIFLDEQDIGTFLSYLKTYLTPKDEVRLHSVATSKNSSRTERQKALKEISLRNFFGKIELLSFALMPNHFHLLVKQNEAEEIDRFMNALGTRYASYFNRRHDRIGPLYQGVYKAVLVYTDEQLLHLSRYIHLNPVEAFGVSSQQWQQIPWPTSLPAYLGLKQTPWVNKEEILSYFNKENKNSTYENFLELDPYEDLITPIAIDYGAD